MNHRFKLHPDGTLEITMPKGKKVSRVLVCEAGTQNGTLMYPDCDDCIKHGGDWECDHVHYHKGKNADKFKSLFGIYATELWAMPEKDFLEWLNSEVSNSSESPNGWIPCSIKKHPGK